MFHFLLSQREEQSISAMMLPAGDKGVKQGSSSIESAGNLMPSRCATPLAGAVAIGADGGGVAGIDRAVFAGGLGLGVGGAAATVQHGIAVDSFQQRIAAVGDASAHHSQRAPLASLSADGPSGMNRSNADLAKLCRRREWSGLWWARWSAAQSWWKQH